MSNRTIRSISTHYEAVFNYATSGILITDKMGRIVAVNQNALKEFGYKEAELLGGKIEILVPDKLKRKHKDHHKSYIAVPNTRIMGKGLSLTGRKKNGKEFPVEVSLTDYKKNGQTFVLAFVSNITARKKAEAEIVQLNDSLEATVEKRTSDLQHTLSNAGIFNSKLQEAILFQNAILKNAGAIIIAVDTKGTIRVLNHEAETELGYKAEEIVGKKKALVFHLLDEVKTRAKELSKELHETIRPNMEVFFAKAKRGLHNEYEWTYKRRDGSLFPVMLNVTALKDIEHKLIGYLGVGINISNRKKTEQDLKDALKKEKELSELKSRFISIASHEFRTPLSTILSSSFLVEKYNTTEDQLKREIHLHRIMEAVNMLTDILNDFLSVGRIEEGKIMVRPVHLNLKEMTAKLIDEIKVTLKEKQSITYRHSGNEDVLMDASLLKHILMNLISNAGKFSDEEGKITIRTVHDSGKLILSVSDNGIGIPKDDQKHLMERFFRGANAGAIQGTGLGLHIVSKYAELMNGAVTCKSKPGAGTTFKIIFSIKKD
jgi:PAS domain S-box-containing protein